MNLHNNNSEFESDFIYDYNDDVELPKNLRTFIVFEKHIGLDFNIDELDDIEITIEMNKPKQEIVFNGTTKIFEKESKSNNTELF